MNIKFDDLKFMGGDAEVAPASPNEYEFCYRPPFKISKRILAMPRRRQKIAVKKLLTSRIADAIVELGPIKYEAESMEKLAVAIEDILFPAAGKVTFCIKVQPWSR